MSHPIYIFIDICYVLRIISMSIRSRRGTIDCQLGFNQYPRLKVDSQFVFSLWALHKHLIWKER